MKRIVIFASGSGTNAENIINYFSETKTAKVILVLCNKKSAKVFDRCKRLNIECTYFSKSDFFETDAILHLLKDKADVVVLAGFLWKIPKNIIQNFNNKILNIHPALLPKYGGKGMYGMHVHNAVVENKEKQTGITIHYVNENYDEGAILFQSKVAVEKSDTAEDIARKVHQLEYAYYPKVIENIILKDA